MNKDQAKEKTAFLIDQASQLMKSKIDKALNSGAIDLDSYEDNYYLPKIVAYALLKDALFQNEPVKEAIKEAENLALFL